MKKTVRRVEVVVVVVAFWFGCGSVDVLLSSKGCKKLKEAYIYRMFSCASLLYLKKYPTRSSHLRLPFLNFEFSRRCFFEYESQFLSAIVWRVEKRCVGKS